VKSRQPSRHDDYKSGEALSVLRRREALGNPYGGGGKKERDEKKEYSKDPKIQEIMVRVTSVVRPGVERQNKIVTEPVSRGVMRGDERSCAASAIRGDIGKADSKN